MINLITRTKEYYRKGRRLKICVIMHCPSFPYLWRQVWPVCCRCCQAWYTRSSWEPRWPCRCTRRRHAHSHGAVPGLSPLADARVYDTSCWGTLGNYWKKNNCFNLPDDFNYLFSFLLLIAYRMSIVTMAVLNYCMYKNNNFLYSFLTLMPVLVQYMR